MKHVSEIISDLQRYPTAVLLLIAEGHRWPIEGVHNPALLVGRLVASVGTRAAPKRVIFRATTNLAQRMANLRFCR
jgi:hypothetical protein